MTFTKIYIIHVYSLYNIYGYILLIKIIKIKDDSVICSWTLTLIKTNKTDSSRCKFRKKTILYIFITVCDMLKNLKYLDDKNQKISLGNGL